jgi:hypothetical protein
MEMVDFCRSFTARPGETQRNYELLTKAVETHVRLMKEAANGFGCDRHLLALSILSQELGMKAGAILEWK